MAENRAEGHIFPVTFHFIWFHLPTSPDTEDTAPNKRPLNVVPSSNTKDAILKRNQNLREYLALKSMCTELVEPLLVCFPFSPKFPREKHAAQGDVHPNAD